MNLVRHALALTSALALALTSAGCAVDGIDSDAEVDAIDFNDASSVESEYWTISGATSYKTWDSGETNNLSAWLYVKCNTEYGSDFMLTGLNVWQENTGNLDNFIGRMGGVCSEYNLAYDSMPQTGVSYAKNIFTSTHYRAGVLGIDVPASNAYPIGVELEVNSTDGYVKDVRIAHAAKTADWTAITSSTPSYTSWATGYTGSNVLLKCNDQEVMTGLQLRYDTDKGKIRKLQVLCTPVENY